jgi:hypothetical protein
LVCSLGIVLSLPPQAAAQSSNIADIPNVANPVNADVLGLRLYMTANEAAVAIQQHLHIAVSASPRGCGNGNPCMKFEAATLTPGKKYVSGLAVQNDRMDLELTFSESYPFDGSRPESLTEISYRPNSANETEQQAFATQVRQKYGPAAPVAMAGSYWCTQGAKSGGFSDIAHSQVSWCVGPTLTFDGTTLYLSDKDLLSRQQAKANARKNQSAPAL